MSSDDRDWWREDRKNKEKIYQGDFSLHSKPYSGKKQRKMPYIQPKGSGNGCGTVFMAVIIVVAIIAAASTLGKETLTYETTIQQPILSGSVQRRFH